MKLTIVLATQRSGSTLLEQSLTNLGGSGRHGEHLIFAFHRARRGPISALMGRLLPPDLLPRRWWVPKASEGRRWMAPIDIAGALERGKDADGNVGITLMANYTSILAAAYFGKPRKIDVYSPAQSARLINSLGVFFDEVRVITNKRGNLLDQALSSYLSNSTGLGHIVDGRKVVRKKGSKIPLESALERLSAKVLGQHLESLEKDNRFIDHLVRRLDYPTLALTYEEVCSDPEGVGRRVLDFVGHDGQPGDFRSKTKKVVDQETTKLAKQKLAAELFGPGAQWSDRDIVKALRARSQESKTPKPPKKS